ncbi:MAG TPA: GTPase ObgE, partial [Candidatus Limnocylindria bacterium]|nr:GTPase ObgE [Candidatus Limnocylindria bacterium]
MFTDRANIFVKGGDGGAGALTFRREKHVPRGGPDGGSGGKGGDVVIEVAGHHNTLQDYRHRHHFAAESGGRGAKNRRHGRQGADLILRVPLGTVVMDEPGAVLGDLVVPKQRLVVALGGRGGRGNATFKTSTHQAPRFAELGAPGESRWLTMELKLVADVGLVGLPNAGKSTVLAAASAARPKIADYPFTTLEPVLGVVEIDPETSFVMADVPGLIEGAHQGAGLGLQFLRHLERTRLLIHVLDVSQGSAEKLWDDYQQVRAELRKYSAQLARRPHLVGLNKMDAVHDQAAVTALRQRLMRARRRTFTLSAATGEGVRELMRGAATALHRARTQSAEKPVPALKVYRGPATAEPFKIEPIEGGFTVSGSQLERLIAMTDLSNPEALSRFQRTLDRWGLTEAL